jgi:hypothetical protein
MSVVRSKGMKPCKVEMKPCWKDAGLDPEGARIADEALPFMMKAVEAAASRSLAESVLQEALFRYFDLPRRTIVWREKYLKENICESFNQTEKEG